ncbi:LytTR family DNA-binding domain-containing protein [Galbibacter sp. EGI 63066]|uniref:LytR/AlgR family response regulator transcription factor n=1 Tax=Galbibacter sp. EGI 63066 TaxID=2993559 RepID=UPI0022499B87|nr:LytTR family DNA-binding domain-containing protein [Galbibacter sp. EGI 63066]MCX2681660.1 LytTR family DNA-binding domain-containing protein [Galbibacter sp. EGI 63066]
MLPYYEELKKVFLFLCFVAIASFLFTYLFEPFIVNVEEHKINNLWIILLHSVIPIPIAFVYFFFLKKSVNNIENWTLGKEFLHLALILLLVGFASFLIRDFIYTNPDNWSFRYLWEEIRNTFLVGSLLLAILLPLNQERLINKHLKDLKKLPTHQQNVKEAITIVQIFMPIAEEKFELNIQSFLFAKVDSNYLEIFYKGSSRLEKDLKRLTLKEFDDQLSSFPFIFKVHRSYVVNLKAIESISGNAQGYILHLKDYSQRTIPVSRSKIEEFNQLYTNLKSQ